MEGTVINTVLTVEIMKIGLNICFHCLVIHIADMEEHGCRLHQVQFFVAHLKGDTAAGCHVTVTGTVDDHLAVNDLQPPLGADQHTGNGFAHQNGTEKIRVIEHLDTGFGEHFIYDDLQSFGFVGGHMLMADLDPGGKGGTSVNLGGMNGKSPLHHPVHDLFKQAPDDHRLTLGIVAGHEGTHQTLGGHTAAAVALFHQDNADALPGRGDEAGQRAAQRAIPMLEKAGIQVRVLQVKDAKDPDEYIKKFGGTRFKKLIEQSAGSVEYELSKIGAKYDTETPEGKIGALKDAVGLLAEMKNPLEREVWAAKLARDYGTTKEGILTQVQTKIKRRARAEGNRAVISQNAQVTTFGGAVPEKLKNPASAAAEERLLGAIMRHPETLSTLSTKIFPEDFVCELYGNFYRKLLTTLSTGFEVSLTLFGEDFTLEQQGIIAKLAHLAREHQYSAEDASEAAKTILRLKEKKTDKEIGELSGAELAAYIEKMRKAKK